MRFVLPIVVLSTLNLWAQGQGSDGQLIDRSKPDAKASGQTAPAAGQKDVKTYQVTVPADAVLPISTLPPSTVIATVDGQKVTAGELQAILKNMPQNVQQQAQSDRRKFVEQYGILRRLSAEARKEKLDEQSPWKEAIEYGTMQVLYQAQINKKFAELPVAQEDIKKEYEATPDKYLQAKVRAIYLPFSSAPVSQADSKGKKILSEAEAKAKAEDLVKQIRAGADFIKLVKENSGDPKSVEKDGDFGYLHKVDPIPEDLKKVIFSAKKMDVTDPVRQPNGFYIFRIEDIGPQPLEQVQGTITTELKNKQFMTWLGGIQKSLDVKMEHEAPPGIQVMPAPGGSASKPSK
jgi:peptidyl-prolyl cis-trans isomerase C